jgi:hypothetical protein
MEDFKINIVSKIELVACQKEMFEISFLAVQ